MQHYQNLLYVSHGASDESDGLKQALALAHNNQAALTVLIVSPQLPNNFSDFKAQFEQSLLEHVNAAIAASKSALNINTTALDIRTVIISDSTAAIKIIQHVIQHGHDLVIKEAQSHANATGFQAIDMALLRKCPAPVCLCKPITKSRQHIKVAVAIDPESQERQGQALSQQLLHVARTLADSCSGDLQIISCWDYAFEKYMRDNIWIKSSESEIAKTVSIAQKEHREALDKLIAHCSMQGMQQIHHLRGDPAQRIPQLIREHDIDILVMGTLARTGISGFIIGNTAENIVQQLNCSLLALKPNGFVSPIHAY